MVSGKYEKLGWYNLISFYSKESLEIIKFRCNKLMVSLDRNRKTYTVLKIVLKEKEIEAELKSYIFTGVTIN